MRLQRATPGTPAGHLTQIVPAQQATSLIQYKYLPHRPTAQIVEQGCSWSLQLFQTARQIVGGAGIFTAEQAGKGNTGRAMAPLVGGRRRFLVPHYRA